MIYKKNYCQENFSFYVGETFFVKPKLIKSVCIPDLHLLMRTDWYFECNQNFLSP